MSSGAFILSRYRASYGDGSNVHPIKIQPETVGLQFGTEINIPSVNSPTSPISAVVSRGSRALGLTPRKVTFRFTGSNPINGTYKEGSTLSVPWLIPFTTALSKGVQGTYLGEAVELVGLIPEKVG